MTGGEARVVRVMRHLTLGTGILLGLAAWSPAQDLSESVEFSHRFGSGGAVGNAVIELSSGGYAAVGYIQTSGLNQIDVYVVRLGVNGEVLWSQTYGQSGDDYGWDLMEHDTGELVVVGYTSSTESGDEDVLLLGIGQDGGLRWRRRFGGDRNERAWRSARTPDGGMVLAGETQSVGESDWDTYLLRLSRDGSQMWAQVLGADGVDRAFDVAVTDDGGFIVVGTTAMADDAPRDLYFTRVDSFGRSMWQRVYGGDGDDVARGILSVGDDGYVVTGYGSSYGAGGNDVYLIYLADDGVVEWRREIGGRSDDRGMMTVRGTDGGFMTIGSSDAGGDWNISLITTDEMGDPVAERTLRSPGPDRGVMIVSTADGGYLLTGALGSSDGSSQFGLVKVRP